MGLSDLVKQLTHIIFLRNNVFGLGEVAEHKS